MRVLVPTAALHAVAIAVVIGRPHVWPFALAAVIANHLLIVIACFIPRSSLFGPNIRRVDDGVIALTFDDGPDPEITPRVLDLLDAAGAKGTFFCIGRKVEAHPAIAEMIRERGHEVQNHSYSHPNLFALWGPRAMRKEIDAAQDTIERCFGARPALFRAPAGFQNPWLFPVLEDASLSLVSWTRRGFDAADGNAARVARRLTRNLKAGDILLLHDDRRVILDALPIVLRAMAEKGLRSQRLTSSLRTR